MVGASTSTMSSTVSEVAVAKMTNWQARWCWSVDNYLFTMCDRAQIGYIVKNMYRNRIGRNGYIRAK